MGPSLLFFVCGNASRAVSLAEQKNSGWSGALKNNAISNSYNNFLKYGLVIL